MFTFSMAKMTGNGTLHGKEILDLIKQPVPKCSIFIIGSLHPHPTPPPHPTNEVLQTHINTNGFNK